MKKEENNLAPGPALDMRKRVRDSLNQMRTAKNDHLLAAFARRTGLKGTPRQIQEHMKRFKRILSPGMEKVLLDGVPLIDFKDPEFKRTDDGMVNITFQYQDHTLL